MTKRNSSNLDVDINADGYAIGGGTTERTLTISGGDVELVGGGGFKVTVTANTSIGGTNTGDESQSTIKTKLGAATASVDGYATATQITKLDGIAAGAEVNVQADWNASPGDAQILNKPTIPTVDATSVAAAGAVMEGDTTTASMSFVVDEDNMASNLSTKVPTQQSVKAYADTKAPSNLAGVNQTKSWTLIDPKGAYGKDHEIFVWKTDAAITITKLEVSCDADPTTELTGDLKYADAFIGLANAVVINDFDTTAGVRSDSSITSGAVGAGKCIYILFDAEPDAAITQINFSITYDND